MNLNKTGIFILKSMLIFLVSIQFSCKSPEPESQGLLQQEDELLAGYTKAVAYSGYRAGQHPDRGSGAVNPADDQILQDLDLLKQLNFGLIRLYDSGENSASVLRLIREHDFDIKVMLGIWLDAEISNHAGCEWLLEPIPESELGENKEKNLLQIKQGIALANEYRDIVIAVNVGNEALVSWTDHMVPEDTIIAYVKRVKQNVSQPVTVAENYDWWAEQGLRLAEQVDFVSVHTYPVWEGKTIDEGLSYTIENMQSVHTTLPESRLVIAEAGWATTASEFGERAGEEQQLHYYKELTEWAAEMNITTFWFEAFDEPWKGDPNNPLGAEKHWGLFSVDREPKRVLSELYPDLFQKK